MNRNLVLIAAFYLLLTSTANGQIDGNLNSIGLDDFKHYTGIDLASGEVDYDKMKSRGEAKVILSKPLFLQKGKGEWLYDADSCGLRRIKAIKLAYLAEGTKVIYCGLSFDAGVKERKAFRAVSYPILEELNVGDTLRFKLTLLADKNKKFQPLIYTSSKMKTKQGKLKNGKYLTFMGAVPAGSVNDQDIVITQVEIPITEENKDMNWLHIVNNEDEQHKGFIIENDYQEGSIDEDYGFQIAYFGNDSFSLSSEGKELLDKIAEDKDSTTCISLRGYADPSGDKTYNLRLAKKRAESVQKYLIGKGVDPERIVIEHFDILNNPKAKDNRICSILVL